MQLDPTGIETRAMPRDMKRQTQPCAARVHLSVPENSLSLLCKMPHVHLILRSIKLSHLKATHGHGSRQHLAHNARCRWRPILKVVEDELRLARARRAAHHPEAEGPNVVARREARERERGGA